jgi:acetylornithine deacetylase/succinyl-diaminopimelate desuccinylase-like protein
MSTPEIQDQVESEITAERCAEICSKLIQARCDPGGKWGWPPEKQGEPMPTRAPAVVAGLLSEIGMDVEVHEVQNAYNPDETLTSPLVQAYLDGESGDKRLEFEAHYDAETVQEELWDRDPFGAEIEGDILHGRGVVDSKGQLAGMIAAVEAINNAGVDLDGDIIISSGPDGEYGYSSWGKSAELDPDIDYIIAGEATYVSDRDVYEIAIAHESYYRFEIEIVGETAHFGEPDKGINALVELGRVIQSMGYSGEGVEFSYEPWEYSDEVTSLPRMALMGVDGTASSGLPNHASVTGIVEAVPGMTEESITDDLNNHLNEVRNSISRGYKPEYNVQISLDGGGAEVPKDNELVQAMESAVEDSHGKTPEPAILRVVYSSAPGIFRALNPGDWQGTPVGVTFGGGNPELAHRDSEYIPIEGAGGLVEQAEIYAKAAVELLSDN